MKPEEYKHIAAWGNLMGSQEWYIKDLQEKAAESSAPIDTVYRAANGDWRTCSGIVNPQTRRYIESLSKG